MRKFQKILIANRGEIACRLILACREAGYATVAVYAEPDADAPHAWAADEAVALAGRTPAESYLDARQVLEAAQRTGADALHPGYGFLSEDAGFARAVEAAGLTWIGPPPEAIARLGHKLRARTLVAEAGVPVLPGGELTEDPASRPAPAHFPVMVKAAGGGGGMGLRRVAAPDALEAAIDEARAQCAAAFAAKGGESAAADIELYWESYLEGARHLEVQIVADRHGAVGHLGERECPIQRRFQKIVEECPSPALDADSRARLGELAVRAAQAVGYANVGTVEFLWTPERGPAFLEMNTRLQVEHPVTELVTGCDLPAIQLRVAEGEALDALLSAAAPRGHAIEARVYAEHPATGAPAPGRIDHLSWPQGPWVRVDAGVEEGQTLSPFYDALMAKVIAWGPDRPTAIRRLALALARTEVAGTLTTNLPLLRAVLADEAFQAGALDTHFLARRSLTPAPGADAPQAAAAAFLAQSAPAGPSGTGGPAPAEGAAPRWAARRWR